jgi:PAS domain S-box-containing protein
MPLRSNRVFFLAAGLLLLAGMALPVGWLLTRENSKDLQFTRNELAAIGPLRALRRDLKDWLDEFSGGRVAPERARQALRESAALAEKAKALGQRGQLILDPEESQFHLAYLCTLRLPERAKRWIEWAALQDAGRALSPRAAQLRQTLMEDSAEDGRALAAALPSLDAAGAEALQAQDRMRRDRLRALPAGDWQRLREAAYEDLRFWELCEEAMERGLRMREADQRGLGRLRLLLVLALFAAGATGAGLLLARASESGSAAVRAQATAALTRSEHNYRTLYLAIPIPAFLYDLETRRFIDANPAAEKLLKLPADQLVGLSLANLVPAALRQEFLAGFNKRDPRADFHGLQRIQDADGKPLDVEVYGRFIELEGRTLRLVLLSDRTEANAAQRALQNSEIRFRALAERSDEAMTLVDGQGRVIWVSDSNARITGWQPAERKGRPIAEVVHVDDLPAAMEMLKRCMAEPGSVHTLECRVLHRAGHHYWAGVSLSNHLQTPGVEAMVILSRDISAEREAREQLRRGGEYFKALIENAGDLVLIYARDGSVRYENPAALVSLGYRPEEAAAFGPLQLVHPEDAGKLMKELDYSPRAQGRQFDAELRLKAKDGSWREFEAHGRNLSDNPVVGGILVQFRDVAASRGAQRQLLQYERLAAIGQTAAGLAHEVRNPLAVINTCAEFLKSQLADRPVLHQDLDSILRQVERLNTLVHEVLERSKIVELRLAEAQAGDLLRRALKAAQIRYGAGSEGVQAAVDCPQELKLMVDTGRMERVLTNLVLNAFQAMGGNGAVTLSARAEGGFALLEVADNGPGIPEEALARVFDPFYSTKDSGSGLGLWICKGIVEEHGGGMEAAGLKPSGCAIRIRLPFSPLKGTAA